MPVPPEKPELALLRASSVAATMALALMVAPLTASISLLFSFSVRPSVLLLVLMVSRIFPSGRKFPSRRLPQCSK